MSTPPPPRSPARRMVLSSAFPALALLAPALVSCGPSTNPDVPRDPLGSLPADLYDGHDLQALLSAPLHDERNQTVWNDAGVTDEDVDTAKRSLAAFFDASYLKTHEHADLSVDQWRETLLELVPSDWESDLVEAFEQRMAYFHTSALRPGLVHVGAPLVAADWFLGQEGGDPKLFVGGTVAWTVLNPTSNAVAATGLRFAADMTVEESGVLGAGRLRVLALGLDMCATTSDDGRAMPALEQSESHQRVRDHVMTTYLRSPRVPREQILDPWASSFDADPQAFVEDC